MKNITLSTQEAKNLLMCIDASAKRGAFEGGELSAVGSVRDLLFQKISEAEKSVEEATNNPE